jgi:hypothetical protein
LANEPCGTVRARWPENAEHLRWSPRRSACGRSGANSASRTQRSGLRRNAEAFSRTVEPGSGADEPAPLTTQNRGPLLRSRSLPAMWEHLAPMRDQTGGPVTREVCRSAQTARVLTRIIPVLVHVRSWKAALRRRQRAPAAWAAMRRRALRIHPGLDSAQSGGVRGRVGTLHLNM